MFDLQAALRSLYDSLNGLFGRMSSNDPQSLWVARIMLRIGEIEQDLSGASDPDALIASLNRYAGKVSMSDPDDSDALNTLLGEIENLLVANFG